MNPYITYREENDKGELVYFILQKEFPHYKVIVSEIPINVLVSAMPITDYKLFLIFNGTLRGNLIPSYQNVDKEISNVMMSMANWFYENRILIEPKKYKKWKLNDTSSRK